MTSARGRRRRGAGGTRGARRREGGGSARGTRARRGKYERRQQRARARRDRAIEANEGATLSLHTGPRKRNHDETAVGRVTSARRPRKARLRGEGETNEASDIDTLVATTFFISREATTGTRASAHPGAARDAPDRTELNCDKQVTRSNRPYQPFRGLQLRSPSSERERSCGTSSRDLSVRVQRVPREAEKVFFVVERASRRREGRVGPKNLHTSSSGHRSKSFLQNP